MKFSSGRYGREYGTAWRRVPRSYAFDAISGVTRLEKALEKQGYGEDEQEDSDAVMGVPGAMLLMPSRGKGAGFEGGYAVIDGEQDEEGIEDDGDPEGCGGGDPRQSWLVETQSGFGGHEEQAGCVPDGHGFAERGGEETQRLGLRCFIDLPDDGIDEEGDGDLVAGHEGGANDSGE